MNKCEVWKGNSLRCGVIAGGYADMLKRNGLLEARVTRVGGFPSKLLSGDSKKIRKTLF